MNHRQSADRNSVSSANADEDVDDECLTLLVHELIASQTARSPLATAARFGTDTLSYIELERRAEMLAAHLRSSGAGPGELVGIYVERGLDMLVGLLGVLRAGAAYVPLDPAYPVERVAYMLADSEARYILTQSALAGTLPEHTASVICLDRDLPPSSGTAMQAVAPATADSLAYVIYTSGSTGKPKGVAIPHRAVVNFLRSMRVTPGLTQHDRLLAVTTLSFDIAGLELYLPLTVGAEVVIASRAVAADGNALAQTIERDAITVMQATPATWRLLLDAGWHGHSGLRILCGGESLPRELARALLPCCAELWNLYGPTETTIWSTLQKVEAGTGAVPIGYPIAETDLHILDETLTPVTPGTAGELFIGGSGLARGYLRREALTAERFVPNPFVAGTRLYRTGDRVKRRADGALEHLGRVDFQVKVRGFRIELGEIEAALDRHAEVRQSVVLAREDVAGDKRLVGYVIAAGEAAPSVRTLRAWLASTLPDYMVPAVFVFLQTFPLTPNGKVDRNALPAPDLDQAERTEHYLAPRTPEESRLVAIWAEVLRLARVGVNDDFFELGGDSLKLAQVATRIRMHFGVDIPLRAMFEQRTIAALVPVVLAADRTDLRETEIPLSAVTRGNDIPLSFAQERVWFLHQWNPDNLAYNFQASVALDGKLDVAALERTLGEILRRHESYRSTFPTVDGRPLQRVHPAVPYVLPLVDFSTQPEAEREAAAGIWCEREFQLRFDLARLPLVRWTLLRFDATRHALVHMEHHLVHDGWSFNVFLRELVALYTAYVAGQESPLAELPVQFAEFATWQHQWMRGAVSERQLAYWKTKFSSIPPLLEMPTRGTRPAVQSFRGASLRPEIPLALCHSLRALGRQQGSTLFMTMLTGFIALLHRYSGANDVPVGTFFANRRSPESESLIGMILNNVVIRAALDGNPTVSELMTQVRDLVLEGSSHQDVPFDRVVEAVQPRRDLSANPLFQIMFSFHDEPMPESPLPDLDVKLTPVLSNGSAKFDLGVIGIPHSSQYLGMAQGADNDGLTMIWEHNTDLFETSTIARMIEHYKILLAGMAENPQRRIADLPLLQAAEIAQLQSVGSATSTDYTLDSSLPSLFEAQVAATPDAVAVVCEGRELSYRALDGDSNRLAHHLRGLGVGRGSLVAICVTRSERMLVGLLGILKAGGAYVPVDPTFPIERQIFMLDDAAITVLVTEPMLVAQLPVAGIKVVDLDSDAEQIAAAPDTTLTGPRATPADLAYVIYTSGSTGRPKGVQIAHAALANLLLSMRQQPGLHATDRLFAVTTLSFDIAGLELYLPLICGARVVIGSRAVVTDGEALAAALVASGATVMQATPTTWQMLLDAGWSGSTGLTALCGGEALPRALAEQLLPRVRALWNMYGPTETTIWSTCERVSSGSGAVPIGRPIGNTRVCVLDHYGNTVPVGIVGELCIGGSGIARGYLGRPELTAEKFIDDPLHSGERLYRTGDQARYRADGKLECLGRTDHQIKLRGFRIELGEVESLLDAMPGVRQSVVIAREDVPGDMRLVAYVAPVAGVELNGAELLTVLKTRLPDYMVPVGCLVLEALPLTPNGKIDRRALPAPSGERQIAAIEYLAPRNAEERALTVIWERLLGVTPIGVRDDFFEVGGHSLLAVRLAARIEAEFGQRVSLAALLQGRTIEYVAGLLRGDRQTRAVSGFLALQTCGERAPIFAVGSHPRYAEIPQRLGTERPFYQLDVYALMTDRMARGLPPLRRVEDLAEHYLPLILAERPTGPYHLGGGCEGAYVAYEMAVRLQQMGHEVGSLIMWIPPALRESRGWSLRRFAAFHAALRLRYLLTGGALVKAGWKSLGVMLNHERIEYYILQALCSYVPRQSYHGEITLVRTAVTPPHTPASINQQWQQRATGGASVHVVPGSHATWLYDHLDDFTGILAARLAATHA